MNPSSEESAGQQHAEGPDAMRQFRRVLADQYAQPDNRIGLGQVLNTLLPLAALWVSVSFAASASVALTVLLTLTMSLFLLRTFALMHECGHGSLFRSPALNRAVGFILGVVTGMPQYVWAQHHRYHHATNGNWAKYRGPLAILSVDEYQALTPQQQRAYLRVRHFGLAPLAGLMYLIVNPRLTWLKGSAGLTLHVLRGKLAQPRTPLRTLTRTFETRYWTSATEYRHMSFNNLALLGAWVLMSSLIGPEVFFPVYLASVALAGGAGIVLFTVQHNFEHAYASGDEDWEQNDAAIHGTSYLVLPAWLNWFTADIGYHHVHHLCSRIPNYRLAECHEANLELFAEVRRLTLADVLPSLKFLLWDEQARRLVSVIEAEAAYAGRTLAAGNHP